MYFISLCLYAYKNGIGISGITKKKMYFSTLTRCFQVKVYMYNAKHFQTWTSELVQNLFGTRSLFVVTAWLTVWVSLYMPQMICMNEYVIEMIVFVLINASKIIKSNADTNIHTDYLKRTSLTSPSWLYLLIWFGDVIRPTKFVRLFRWVFDELWNVTHL